MFVSCISLFEISYHFCVHVFFRLREGYEDLLRKEIEKRKAWIEDNEGVSPENEGDFKDFKNFYEFKLKYDQNKVG